MQLAFQRLCISHNDCSNGKSWETTSSVEGMSSCKCNIIVSACVAFIAQSVAGCHSFLVSLAIRGDFPQWNLRKRWWKQKACWLNQHKTTTTAIALLCCCSSARARGITVTKWAAWECSSAKRHSSISGLASFALLLQSSYPLDLSPVPHHLLLPRILLLRTTENYKASWTPQKSLIGAAESLLLWWWKWATHRE